jgi:hypothetical protein
MRLWNLFLLAVLMASTSYAAPWADAWEAPRPVSVSFADPTCKSGCEMIVTFTARGKSDPQHQAVSWAERMRTNLDVSALVGTGCVLDDGPRPQGFGHGNAACEPDRDEGPRQAPRHR